MHIDQDDNTYRNVDFDTSYNMRWSSYFHVRILSWAFFADCQRCPDTYIHIYTRRFKTGLKMKIKSGALEQEVLCVETQFKGKKYITA